MKKILFLLYLLPLLAMGVATFVEHNQGSAYAARYIYGSLWFSLLWAALTFVSIIYYYRQGPRRAGTVLLHASFVLFLTGALLTSLTAYRGTIHLRLHAPTASFTLKDDGAATEQQRTLPFKLRLDRFDVLYHAGTSSAKDYVSRFTILDGASSVSGSVSMNRIFTYRNVRLYQSAYDDDSQGAYLTINADPWGIPVTYAGYALLFLSLIWLLIDPKGTFRRLLRGAAVGLFFAVGLSSAAAPALPADAAHRMGCLDMLYNGRICPVQTYALDFTTKIYGQRTYNGYTAEQVLTGWIFWGNQWTIEPMIRVKDAEVRQRYDLPKYASLSQFFNASAGGYILGPAVREYAEGNRDGFHKDVAELDANIKLIMDLRRGLPLKFFPVTTRQQTTWFAPADSLPQTLPTDEHQFIDQSFAVWNAYAQAGDWEHLNRVTDAVRRYQGDHGGASLPSTLKIKAELQYNKWPFTTILFIFNLMLGFLSLFYVIYLTTHRQTQRRFVIKWLPRLFFIAALLAWGTLTYYEILRWIITGTIPMANGYETMLLLAWFVQLLTLIVCLKNKLVLTFGFLLAGFFLLVAHLGQLDPQITPLMPVLASPLLSVHVSIIMMSFALLSLTFICGLTALISRLFGADDEALMALRRLSLLFLYPALTTLGIGIFIGAIWANVSWGQYWSWDPKEVWALITFMTYGIVVHTHTLPLFRRPLPYHWFVTLAFLTILMTYFGVNFFLGGMHSYA